MGRELLNSVKAENNFKSKRQLFLTFNPYFILLAHFAMISLHIYSVLHLSAQTSTIKKDPSVSINSCLEISLMQSCSHGVKKPWFIKQERH